MTLYEVEISRKYVKSSLDRFLQGQYWWDVDVRLNGKYQSDLSSCGWAKSGHKAKLKALKHIADVEDRVGIEHFGVIIKTEGDAAAVREALGERQDTSN